MFQKCTNDSVEYSVNVCDFTYDNLNDSTVLQPLLELVCLICRAKMMPTPVLLHTRIVLFFLQSHWRKIEASQCDAHPPQYISSFADTMAMSSVCDKKGEISKYFGTQISNPEKNLNAKSFLLILYKTNIESCYTCKYVRLEQKRSIVAFCKHSIVNCKSSAINESTLSYHNKKYTKPKF